MKQKGLKSLLLAVMLSVLTLLCISCTSSPEPTPIPIDWPPVPDPAGQVWLLQEDTVVQAGRVVMELEYWIELARYVVAVERVRESMEGE